MVSDMADKYVQNLGRPDLAFEVMDDKDRKVTLVIPGTLRGPNGKNLLIVKDTFFKQLEAYPQFKKLLAQGLNGGLRVLDKLPKDFLSAQQRVAQLEAEKAQVEANLEAVTRERDAEKERVEKLVKLIEGLGGHADLKKVLA